MRFSSKNVIWNLFLDLERSPHLCRPGVGIEVGIWCHFFVKLWHRTLENISTRKHSLLKKESVLLFASISHTPEHTCIYAHISKCRQSRKGQCTCTCILYRFCVPVLNRCRITCFVIWESRIAGTIEPYQKLSAHMTVGLVTYPLNRSFNSL